MKNRNVKPKSKLADIKKSVEIVKLSAVNNQNEKAG